MSLLVAGARGIGHAITRLAPRASWHVNLGAAEAPDDYDHSAILSGMWCALLIAAALAPPIWHEGLMMLDSCPCCPGCPTAGCRGSCRTRSRRCPAVTRTTSGSCLLSIQSALIGGRSFLRWLHR